MSTKTFELQKSSQESSKINKYHRIQSLLHAQTRDYHFPFAQHRKQVGNVGKKSKFCRTLVEMFQLLAYCKSAAIFQFLKDQPRK